MTSTHPSYNLSLINHMISSSVLPLHPHSHISKVSATPLFTALSCPMCSVSSCTSKVQDYLKSHQMHYHLWTLAWSFSTTIRTSLIWNSAHKLSQPWICAVVLPYPKFSALLKKILSFPTITSLLQPFLHVAKIILNSYAILSFTSVQLPVDCRFNVHTTLLSRLQ